MDGKFLSRTKKAGSVLPYYATLLDSVELNNSFYKIPVVKNVKHWAEITPPNFIFACKANRYITHFQRLKDSEESLKRMLDSFLHFEE